jgi:hypothetical protein
VRERASKWRMMALPQTFPDHGHAWKTVQNFLFVFGFGSGSKSGIKFNINPRNIPVV